MNQKNLDFLKDQIKYTGFGEMLEEVLKEKLAQGEKEFKVNHQVSFGTDSLSVDLNFKKSEQSDMYFFNSYHVALEKEQSKEKLEQTIYLNKDSHISLKEAYNLMDGRAVNKDLKNKQGEVYNAWLKMDFKQADDKGNFKITQYHQNYGYDLENSLAKHPIKELGHPKYKDDLMSSLKRGNVQSVTFVVDGAEKKHFVEANPQFKTINVYDAAMQRINTRETKSQKEGLSESQSEKKSNKQQQDGDSEPVQEQSKTVSKKRKASKSL